MKTALVTGSSGFVGRHMTAELKARGWQVTGCDVVDLDGRPRALDALQIFRLDDSPRYDLVVHCAARAPHRAAIDGQPMNLPYNLQLDSAMFDWAVRTGQQRVLYLSSSAVYPVLLQEGFPRRRLHESATDMAHGIEPDAAYGWTKWTGEKMAAAAAAVGLAVHVVRPFSGYGEDQATDWPFGAFVDRARRREDPFVIWGSGDQVRDWIHISDVVAGALAVVDADVRVPVNLCTGLGTRMYDLVDMIRKQAGYRPTIFIDPDRPEGVAYRVGDPDRFWSIYQPKVSLEEGVARAMRQGAPA
ncbi:NAD-dependent epimerase/dehydratase family protein [Streptomyces sp. NPDC020951]|uniref:NAD-dependent epimerase/dehydratase family protein n=1 Tax=Streptomyces sp. NPDC020951 TaxID=3365104 RepID=UPI003792171D